MRLNVYISLGTIAILTLLRLLIKEHFPCALLFFKFFHQCLWYSEYEFCISFINMFIFLFPLMLLQMELLSQISFLVCLLQVCRNIINFSILTTHLAILLNLLVLIAF